MSPKSAIRRLLKSRLRLYIFRALAVERSSGSWASAIEVEEGISEDAWAAWTSVRAAQVDYDLDAKDGLREAALSAQATFKGAVDIEWLDQRIEAFFAEFRLGQLMEGPCASATS